MTVNEQKYTYVYTSAKCHNIYFIWTKTHYFYLVTFTHFVRRQFGTAYCLPIRCEVCRVRGGWACPQHFSIQAQRHVKGYCDEGLGILQVQGAERRAPTWGVRGLRKADGSMLRYEGWIRVHIAEWEEMILQAENNVKVT